MLRTMTSKQQRRRQRQLEGLEASKQIAIDQIKFLMKASKERTLTSDELEALKVNTKILSDLKAAEAKEIVSINQEMMNLTDAQLEEIIRGKC